MTGLDLDHVAIAVPSLGEAIAMHESLSGLTATAPETLPVQGVRVAFVGSLELLEPISSDTPVGRFLSRRGPGLHHIAYHTDGLERELERLTAQGFQPIDRTPRPGARGHRASFLHPRTAGGVLIELVERRTTPA